MEETLSRIERGMKKTTICMSDGRRYLIYYTFGDETTPPAEIDADAPPREESTMP
jgi:hypothetical protein